jgi:EGF domain/HYR domain
MGRVSPSWIVQSSIGIALALALNAAVGLTVPVSGQAGQAAAPAAAVSGDACAPGFSGSPETGCLDVNECATDNGGCSRFARCNNTPGSRTCGSCPDGYAGDGYLGCFDVNECPAGDCSSKIPVVPENDKPPVVTTTGDVTAAATSDGGASVTFKATAKDSVDGTLQAYCTPRSGSTFKVGKSTVTCWSYNTRGEIGRATLTVTVTK